MHGTMSLKKTNICPWKPFPSYAVRIQGTKPAWQQRKIHFHCSKLRNKLAEAVTFPTATLKVSVSNVRTGKKFYPQILRDLTEWKPGKCQNRSFF